jgi:hypothetical protein
MYSPSDVFQLQALQPCPWQGRTRLSLNCLEAGIARRPVFAGRSGIKLQGGEKAGAFKSRQTG